MKNERETLNSGKMWIIIGISIAIIGLLFTIAMSVVFNQNINRLSEKCEKTGGTPIVQTQTFLGLKTSYNVSCDKETQ